MAKPIDLRAAEIEQLKLENERLKGEAARWAQRWQSSALEARGWEACVAALLRKHCPGDMDTLAKETVEAVDGRDVERIPDLSTREVMLRVLPEGEHVNPDKPPHEKGAPFGPTEGQAPCGTTWPEP